MAHAILNEKIMDRKIFKTICYFSAFMMMGMFGAILGPTLPELAQQTNSPLKSMSILFTIRALGGLLGSFVGGQLYDKVKGHPIIGAMLIIVAILLALVPTLKTLSILILLFLILGICNNVSNIGGNTLLIWIHQEKVTSYMNALHFFFGFGALIAPLIVAQVITFNYGIEWAYWLLAMIILPAGILFLFVPSPAVKKVSNKTNGKISNPLLTVSIILFLFFWVGIEVGFGGWIYSYALKTGLTDKAGAAYLISIFWGAFTISRLLSIPLAIRIRPVTFLYINLIGTLVSISCITLFPGSYMALLIGTGGAGIFMASVFPTTFSFSERRMVISARVTSWFFIGGSIGAMTIPWLMGQVIETQSIKIMNILLGTLLLTLITLTWICFGLKPKLLHTEQIKST